MTLKFTQHAWFSWFSDGERLVDTRKMLFEARATGQSGILNVTLQGDGYYLEVAGKNLEVNKKGQLVRGEINHVVWYDDATDKKMLTISGTHTNVKGFLRDYNNDVHYPVDPKAEGMIFDASDVGAWTGGVGIGVFGADGGNDTILGSAGGEELIGFSGDDEVYGNGGHDKLWGDQGNDTVVGGNGHDTLNGGDGNDLLVGENGNDFHYGWIGKDTIEGGWGNDFAYGGAGKDDIHGGEGNDFLVGDAGEDKLDGGDGSDWASAYVDDKDTTPFKFDLNRGVIKSSFGTDTLNSIENAYGGGGTDDIKGDGKANKLFGYGGADTISGGDKNDTLWGGSGNDKLTGGEGADTFFFWEFGTDHSDRIVDFTPGSDKIIFTKNVFEQLPLGRLRAENFVVGADAKDTNDYVIYDQQSGRLYFDPNPKTGLGPGLVATLDGKPTLTVDDFKVLAVNDFNHWL